MPRQTVLHTAVAAATLLAAVACADAPTVAPSRGVPNAPRLTSYAATPADVPCQKEWSSHSRGLHAAKGWVRPQSPPYCDALVGTAPIRMYFQYVMNTLKAPYTGHYVYVTVVSTSGGVTNTLLYYDATRVDSTMYDVDYTLSPNDTMERVIISVSHNELAASGSSPGDREIVYHLWRPIPQPVLTATQSGSTVALSWVQNHHFLTHLVERSCDNEVTWVTLRTISEPYTTTHTTSDTPPASGCAYRIRAYMDHGAYTDIGSNVTSALTADTAGQTHEADMVWTESAPVTVGSPPPVHITSPSGTALGPATVGTAFTVQFQAADGATPYSWSATGAPAGLSMNGSTGVLAGTPTTAGDYTVSVTVTASGSADTKSYSLHVAPRVRITSTSPITSATAGTAYSYQFTAADGNQPYTWTTTGSVPGLTLGSSGVLSGTPTTGGDYSLPITVSANGSSASGTFALHVAAPPPPPSLYVSIFGPLSMRPSKTCTWSAEVSGGSGVYTYAWYRNNSLVSTADTYTGTSGSTSFTLRLDVSSSDGLAGTNSRTVTVSTGAPIACISG